MNTQPEQILEDNLVAQLQKLGYSYVDIKDEKDLLANLKTQLEKHNKITFSVKEFEKILNNFASPCLLFLIYRLKKNSNGE